MKDPRVNKILAVTCWIGTALCAFLALYLVYMAREFPGMEAFTRFSWLAGLLAALWGAAAVWFTVLSRQGRKK